MMGDIYRQARELQIWLGEGWEMFPDKHNSDEENLLSEDQIVTLQSSLSLTI